MPTRTEITKLRILSLNTHFNINAVQIVNKRTEPQQQPLYITLANKQPINKIW